jgi:MoaA/NifB/PqqE/SkfB family radical SAM enzyme
VSLREVHWEITNGCNLRCKHCLSSSGIARIGELTTEESLTALETFREAGVSRAYFTGGEPFSRKDFLSILEHASALGMRSTVITNATLLQEAELEGVKKKSGMNLRGAEPARYQTLIEQLEV